MKSLKPPGEFVYSTWVALKSFLQNKVLPVRTIIPMVCSIASIVLPGFTGSAATLTVSSLNDSVTPSAGELRYAVQNASDNDIIVFDASLFAGGPGTITFDASQAALVIRSNLTIVGPGPELLTIDSGGSLRRRVFEVLSFKPGVLSDVRISGLKITGGLAPQDGGLPPVFIPTQSRGGGIYSAAALTLSNCWVVGNRATSGPTYAVAAFGGGIYSQTGTLLLVDCIVSNNLAQADNGAGYVASGGGIFVSPPSTPVGPPFSLLRSTVSGNVAEGSGAGGGGVFIAPGVTGVPPSIMTNGTVSMNLAQSTASAGIDLAVGGGLSLTNTALVNCTVVSNRIALAIGRAANFGFAAGISGTGVILKNTIIANNQWSLFPELRGSFLSAGYNLIGQATGFTSFMGDQVGTSGSPIDPMVGPLQNNGGPTPTHALLPGSTAIDMGNNSGAPATDQRGVPRPGASSAVDIGAYEFEGAAGPLTIQCAADVETAAIGCATMRTLSIPAQVAMPNATGGSGTKVWTVRFEGEVVDYSIPSSLTFSLGVTNLVWTVTAGEESQSCTQRVTLLPGSNIAPTLNPAFAPPPVMATNAILGVSLIAADSDSLAATLTPLPPISSNPSLATATNTVPFSGYYSVVVMSSDGTGTVTFTNVVMDECGGTATNTFTITIKEPPAISEIPDQTIPSNATVLTLPFQIGGGTAPLNAAAYFQGSSYGLNTMVTGSGNNRLLHFTVPALNSAILPVFVTNLVYVTDAEGLTSSEFLTIHILEALDSDGISDSIEDSAPNGGDGNSDGIPDRLQSHVVSLLATVDSSSYLTLVVSNGLRLTHVEVVDPPDPSPGTFPYRMTQYRVEGLPALGDSIIVTQTFHAGLPAGMAFYKYGRSAPAADPGYFAFMYSGPGTTGAEIIDNTILLHLTDGMLGDDDWTENGIIVDPGGPALLSLPSVALTISRLPGNQAQISWPLADGGAALKYATNLVSPISWQTDMGTVVTNGDTKSVTIDLNASPRFYRLGPP